MRRGILAVALFLSACGNQRESSSGGPLPSAAPSIAPSTLRSAEETYREAVLAWNEGDRDAYFAAYAERLDCWYNEAGVARADIERGPRGARFRSGSSATMIVESLMTVRSSPAEVMLLDEGSVWSQGSSRAHRKLLVMRRFGNEWRIVVEVSPSSHACWQDVPAGFRPSSTDRPRRAQRTRVPQGCRVIRIEEHCQSTAGEPPCQEHRFVEHAPPVPPGAGRRTSFAAIEAYVEGVNCELSPSFGPTGRVVRVGGHCMGVGMTSWVYQGCE